MILRRFTLHINDQNWFAVGLDLAVVVLGIFIGMQVSEWNQSRKDHQEGLYYLQALNTQILDDIETGADEIKISENLLASSFQALEVLWSDESNEGDLLTFQEQHISVFQFWGPLKRPAALRQLIDGGKIDLIDSKTFKEPSWNMKAPT